MHFLSRVARIMGIVVYASWECLWRGVLVLFGEVGEEDDRFN